MKILSGRIVPILGSCSLLTCGAVQAQDFFRDFGSSRSSGGIGRLGPGAEVFLGNNPNGIQPLTDTDLTADERAYNIRIGALDLRIAAGASFEFNDNITLAEFDRVSDIIFRPQVDVDAAIRFSETSRLRLGVGLSYAKYFDNSQFDSDSILISPTSAIVWTAESGPFRFTVRERLSYQEDPFALPVLQNVARYQRWENQAGIQVDWDANEFTKIAVGYDRYDLWTTNEFYESLDRSVDTIFVRPSYQVHPRFTVGLNGSYSMFRFSDPARADGYALLIGPFVRWQISDFTELYAEVGYQQMAFDGVTAFTTFNFFNGLPTGIGFDADDASSFYARVDLVSRPTEFLRHRLSMSKTSELGFQSNFYDLYHIEYSLDWAFRENTSLRPTLFYEYFVTSGDIAEKAHRFGAALGLYHAFSDNFTAGLDYRFIVRDSNLNGADYYQHLGMVSLYYKF